MMDTVEDATNIEDQNLEDELSNFLHDIVDRTRNLMDEDINNANALSFHITLLDQTINFIRSAAEINDPDYDIWIALASVFLELLTFSKQRKLELLTTPTMVTRMECGISHSGQPGRPSFIIPSEMLEDLRGYGFSWNKIAQMLGVSRWTIHRRVISMDLSNLGDFTLISDNELDQLISDYINRHGATSGLTYITGYLRSIGFRIQRHRIRESMTRVQPRNAILRWGMIVQRRKYHVPWPNSLWHLDGHHSLIRWSLVVHGCIDRFSRRIIYLQCSTNNLSETVLALFLNATEDDGGLWPSRIRVDRGVENVRVCDAMVEARGEGRGSFIAGPSTHNQRIERLWRDVFRCVLHYFTTYFMPWKMLAFFFLTIPRMFLYYATYFCLELIKHCRNTSMLLTTMAFGQPIIGRQIKCG